MGPIGLPEILMIFLALAMLAIPVCIVLALVWYFCIRTKPPEPPHGSVRVEERPPED